jgi:hypothetical protein
MYSQLNVKYYRTPGLALMHLILLLFSIAFGFHFHGFWSSGRQKKG